MLCRQVFTGASQQVFTGAGQQVFKSHLNAGQYVVRFGSVRHWQQQQRDKREQQEREGREGEEEKAQQYHQPWFSTEADEALPSNPLELFPPTTALPALPPHPYVCRVRCSWWRAHSLCWSEQCVWHWPSHLTTTTSLATGQWSAWSVPHTPQVPCSL
ncbi:unnamed protein product [Closterium sp. NIES-54]